MNDNNLKEWYAEEEADRPALQNGEGQNSSLHNESER